MLSGSACALPVNQTATDTIKKALLEQTHINQYVSNYSTMYLSEAQKWLIDDQKKYGGAIYFIAKIVIERQISVKWSF